MYIRKRFVAILRRLIPYPKLFVAGFVAWIGLVFVFCALAGDYWPLTWQLWHWPFLWILSLCGADSILSRLDLPLQHLFIMLFTVCCASVVGLLVSFAARIVARIFAKTRRPGEKT
jgi:hypothetical protein